MVTHMEGWLPRHRITVDEYYRMAEVGLLAHDTRVELIEGEIIDLKDRLFTSFARLPAASTRTFHRSANPQRSRLQHCPARE
jgi:hypothetical protein